jgi:hypothetical protein
MMKKTFIIITGLFLMAIGVAIVYFDIDFKKDNSGAQISPIATATHSNPDIKKYTNAELGLSFEYPARFGDVKVEIMIGGKAGGQTGEKLIGSFSQQEQLEFGGITEDFSAGRSGLLTDTRGFLEKNGHYYFKFVSAKPVEDYEVLPKEVIVKNFGKILVLDNQSFEGERYGVEGPVLGVGAGRLAALVNLKNSKFPGLVFYDWDIQEIPLAEFKAILNSLNIF